MCTLTEVENLAGFHWDPMIEQCPSHRLANLDAAAGQMLLRMPKTIIVRTEYNIRFHIVTNSGIVKFHITRAIEH